MTRRRAICVSRDRTLRGVVEGALTASGLLVEHAEQVPGDARDAVVVVVDRDARREAGDALREVGAPVVVVGDDLDDDALVSLMLDGPVSHLVVDPRDRDLGITTKKLASGDWFGLEQYLGAGARVGERVVASDIEKRRAIDEVCAWADAIGARRPVVHRIASVVDELVMNALYDTPEVEPARCRAVLRWGADARTIAVSVSDAFGGLRQRDVIDNLRRARAERGRPQPETDEQRGAGLGLYLVLSNVSSLVVNVDRGRQTEVVCLFDRAPRADRAQGLHVFAS